MTFEQARAEGLCLRYPENLGMQASVTYEMAVSMLTKALQVSQQVPYTWGWIDRPSGMSIGSHSLYLGILFPSVYLFVV
jgi:hypothetical protein